MTVNHTNLNQENLFAAIRRSLAMIVFDAHGNIMWANDNFSKVVGYRTIELENMHHSDLCPISFKESRDYISFWNNLRDNKAFHDKVTRVKNDGDIIWLEAIYTPVVNANNEVESIIKIATDITQQEKVLRNSSDEFMALVEEMTASTNEVHIASVKAVDDIEKLKNESNIVRDNVEKIDSMASTVKTIATQSHVLGINASIEAARAGEHGRGFAVVANEVQKLASTSKGSAEDIAVQLEQINESVRLMTEMVEQVTESINNNSIFVDEIKKAYEHITKTAEDLLTII